tara:strand:- start:28 stop:225 length:198 start_codon:yes stop_codon:yes gene_type:complete
MYVLKRNIQIMSGIQKRIENIIEVERLSISAFERVIGYGRNSISTSSGKSHRFSSKLLKKFMPTF